MLAIGTLHDSGKREIVGVGAREGVLLSRIIR